MPPVTRPAAARTAIDVAAVRAADSVEDALGAAIDALAAAGVDTPRLDAELMLAAAAGTGRERLIASPEAPLDPAAGRRFGAMVRRRLSREPVAYILGSRWFRGLELGVDRRVLIPRPETELLVEVALELQPRRVLEVGTGSGAVALALADELHGPEVVATDTSPAALAVARANAHRLGLSDRVRFAEGSLPAAMRFDLLLANLPYVAESDWEGLPPEVREWEPREALHGGPDGLDAIRNLLAGAASTVRRGEPVAEAIALEVGAGQAPAVARLLAGAGWPATETRTDLAGIERAVLGRR
jgi:release factor glutamine methyltransferase